ncbi:MAG: anthranilate synthase component I [Desulfobacteraceae bacterium]|nr:MAG: anthranilate synthase component I [Desulfobacteraceae bacterium]
MLLRKFPDHAQFQELARTHNVIPLGVEILADMETPVSLLAKLYRKQGPIFLLESVEGGEKWGRYSFIGTSAHAQVRVFRDTVQVTTRGGTEIIPHGGDPLQVLKSFLDRFKPAALPELPRFWGGLVGYLTYEMVSFFETRVPNRLPHDRPLAHFMLPEELLIFDNIRNTLMCLSVSFIERPDTAGHVYASAANRLNQLLRVINMPLAAEPVNLSAFQLSLQPVLAEETFRGQVAAVKNYIRNGDIIQAVISQPFTCPPPYDMLALYRAQRYINPSPYLFFMHLGEMVLAGSSPETMVRLENRVATLRPIAGTRPRGNTEQADRAMADELLQDEKERAEHLMLVDLGRNDLGRVARTGTVQVTDLMVVERYSHVMHLVSNIICEMKPECNVWDLLRASFPAGTLSGAPKVRAMEIIAEMEQAPRGTYGGAVGYISFNGNMDMAITIRTACVQDGLMTVRAGAGIVADSDPERERQESVNKAMSVQKALALAQIAYDKESRP